MGILIIFINIKIIYFNIILRYLPLANSQIYVAWMGIGKSGNRQYICIICLYLYQELILLFNKLWGTRNTFQIFRMQRNDLKDRASEQGSRKPISLPPVKLYQGKDTTTAKSLEKENMLIWSNSTISPSCEIPKYVWILQERVPVSRFRGLTLWVCEAQIFSERLPQCTLHNVIYHRWILWRWSNVCHCMCHMLI